MKKQYKLRYLPLFRQDVEEMVLYISRKLHNPSAAERLLNDIEAAVLKRLENPESFEPYHSEKERKYPYYRIYVRNYVCLLYTSDAADEL